jgi:long-chain-fatty-acid--CoA ligase ACSBG
LDLVYDPFSPDWSRGNCIFYLQTEVVEATQQPTDKLLPAALEWCHNHGSEAQTVSDVQNDTGLHRVIQSAIDDINKISTSRAQCIQKWTILPRDFSVHGGELGKLCNIGEDTLLTGWVKIVKMGHETILVKVAIMLKH